jgi:hypothetical protein
MVCLITRIFAQSKQGNEYRAPFTLVTAIESGESFEQEELLIGMGS